MRTYKIVLPVVALLGLAACGNTPGQRALTGGGIGAGSGALLGVATGGSPLTGAVLGGLGGAVIGAVTTPTQAPVRSRRYYRGY